MGEKKDKAYWQKKGTGHRGRLRDRFVENGIDGFTDAEVLELLLSFGTPRADCKEPARALLSEFKDFPSVLEAHPSALQKISGIGPKNGFAIAFIHAVAAKYLEQRIVGKSYIKSSEQVIEYLRYKMTGLKREVLCVVFLDSSHAIISSEIVAVGSLNTNAVYPRELVVKALEYHAAAIILSHNHPSGELLPSKQDILLTKTLFHLFKTLQITLLDHIIIGNGAYSFADHGLMAEAKRASDHILQSLKN